MRRTPSAARRSALASLVAGAAVVGLSAPSLADDVLVMTNHTDAMSMMGTTTPAQDEQHEYWFGDQGTRFDGGDTTMIMRLDAKKLYFVHHADKQYSTIDLPFSFESLVPPEMAPMMEMMAKSMAATTTVTPSDKRGEFAGVACSYSKVDISMAMMKMSMNVCSTETLPIDLARYRSLQESQSELAPNMAWVKDLAEKVKGFPVRSDTTTTVMGKSFASWSELKAVEQRTAPAGHYDPPAGYKEVKYDPMAQMQQQGKKKRG